MKKLIQSERSVRSEVINVLSQFMLKLKKSFWCQTSEYVWLSSTGIMVFFPIRSTKNTWHF